METPLEVDFESLEPSSALADAIHREVVRLERRVPRLLSCHVVVREPHRRQRRGRQFEVRIHVTLPGGEVAVSRGPRDRGHDDPYRAVRDAFAQAHRQLRDFLRVRHAA